ncbi:MAG TPA: hypothetical protein DCS93_13570 [Microscillaceae bacterium]|nr:hypothetical protein [Microscillaceae bacterium]
MEENDPIKETTRQNHDSQWVKEVARQSWEPELLISGAAAYASLSLPDVFKSVFLTYQSEYMIGSSFLDLYFPALIYSVFASIGQILILTFVLHFSMRAFWVGMVGLLSVYPEGIRFDEIKYVNNYGKEFLKRKLTSVEEFIIRLDKWCSVLFSIAFIIVLVMLGVAFMYGMFFLVVAVGKMLVPGEWLKSYEIFITFFIAIVFGILMIVVIVLKQMKKSHKAEKWGFLLNYRMSQLIFPLISKATPYLMYTFYSNLSRRTLMVSSILIGTLFAVLLVSNSNDSYTRKKIVGTRSYFSKGSAAHLLQSDYYENLRDAHDPVEHLTIQSDIVKEPFLKLFIAYPKRLDFRLEQFCKPAIVDTKIPKPAQREMRDAHYLACFKQMYQVFINQQPIEQLNFMYYVHPTSKAKGIIAYIPIDDLINGSKNLLQIKTKIPNPLIKKKQRTAYEYSLPFWYIKEK